MTKLTVHLSEGFADDRVVLRLDGRELYAKDGVTTKRLISLADSVRVETPPNPQTLQIDVPSKSLSASIPLDLGRDAHVALSIEGGRITHYVSPTPLGFQ